uniref:Tetratricopeptide repeat protein n=1 Tax=candidate division WOR-3 bacterium TaxID=2052148 RepID=A0A7V0Z688_UNCW3
MDDRKGLFVRALRELGKVCFLIGKYDDALNNFQKLCRNSADSKLNIAQAKRYIAGVFEKTGRYDEALNLLDEIEGTLGDISEEEKIERADSYILRGLIYRTKGKLKDAVCESEKGIKIIEELEVSKIKKKENKIRIKQITANAYNNLAVLYYLRDDYDKAIELYQKHLKISKAIRDKQGIGQAYNNLANIYCDRGDCGKAIALYKKALKILEVIGYKQAVGQASGNLGLVHCEKGDYDEAIRFYKRHLQISEEIGYKQGAGVANCNLGVVNYEKGDYDTAIRYYQKSLEILRTIGHKYGIGLNNHHLGNAYKDKGYYHKAVQLFEKYLEVSEEIQNHYGIASANLDLGLVLLEMAKIETGPSVKSKKKQERTNMLIKRIENYLKNSEKIFNRIKEKQNLVRVYSGFAQLQDIKQKASKMTVLGYGTASRRPMNSKSVNNALRKYAGKILKIANELESQEAIADCYFAYSKVYSLMLSQSTQPRSFNVSKVSTAKPNIKFIFTALEKAIAIYKNLKRNKNIADCYWEYAKILRFIGNAIPERPDKYINESIAIYKRLRLNHRIREIEKTVLKWR